MTNEEQIRIDDASIKRHNNMKASISRHPHITIQNTRQPQERAAKRPTNGRCRKDAAARNSRASASMLSRTRYSNIELTSERTNIGKKEQCNNNVKNVAAACGNIERCEARAGKKSELCVWVWIDFLMSALVVRLPMSRMYDRRRAVSFHREEGRRERMEATAGDMIKLKWNT
ncbi:hypothetical protein BD410DRAFT_119964 [Rickenella mellea]|uniref:Uncharacterized protein n=1 Tax=Rickenella mellea TaxID=50990 RepID=A0A4Y7QC20_9AGAM|nr:hypothetical protein BD410DRAFT_119964 [Rickenella mellea]